MTFLRNIVFWAILIFVAYVVFWMFSVTHADDYVIWHEGDTLHAVGRGTNDGSCSSSGDNVGVRLSVHDTYYPTNNELNEIKTFEESERELAIAYENDDIYCAAMNSYQNANDFNKVDELRLKCIEKKVKEEKFEEAVYYAQEAGLYEKAKEYMTKAAEQAETSGAWKSAMWNYIELGDFKKAEEMRQKAIKKERSF